MLQTTRATRPIRRLEDIELLEKISYDELVPSRNIYEVFQATAELHGERPALTMLPSADLNDVPRVYTHRELLAEINRAANMFVEFGVAGTDVIAILSRSHARIPALMWGAETAGVVSCINYLLEPEAIVALLESEKAQVLVCPGPDHDAEIWKKAQAVIARMSTLKFVLVLGSTPDGTDTRVHSVDEAMDKQPADRLAFSRRPGRDSIAALFHTGGTTGVPKLVPQTHLNQIHAAWSLAQLFSLTEHDVALNGFPLFHVGGASTIGLSVLAAGGHNVILSPSGLRDPAIVRNIWKLVERYRASVIGGVPTSIGSMSEIPVAGCDLSSVRFAFTGGASIPAAIAQRFEQRTGIKLLEQYGMTESVAALATTPFHGKHLRGSVGMRCPFSQIHIMERDEGGAWRECPAGNIGSVVVSGPQIVSGYLDPHHNLSTFTPDGKLITGDLGHLNADGYLFLTAREKDLIIRSGHNIDPLAIEEVANAHPAVAVSAAVGMPDGYAGELPVVFVAPSPGHSIDTAELQAFIAARIPEPPAKPRYVFVLDTIPVTGVGKIFKPALRELALNYKLRMEVAALDAAIEVLDVACGSAVGSTLLTLRAAHPAEQAKGERMLADALARLPVTVQVEWVTGSA